jgi:methylmalonyl-CoA mutase N-terminal domain/subunit
MAESGFDLSSERTSASGIRLRPFYGPGNLGGQDPRSVAEEVPGKPPFTRGAYPGMYRTRPWRIFELSGYGNPEDEGARIRFLLGQGETGFIMEHDRNIADHLYDLDHPEVVARREDVGLTGAVILSARDYATVLEGIPLDRVYAHPGGGVVQHGPFTLACYWHVATQRGYSLDALYGTGQSDFFLTYLGAIAKQQIPARDGLRLNCDIVEFCVEHLPHWVPVSIAGYNGAETGLNGYQELGAVIANAFEYVDSLLERGRIPKEAIAHRVGGINLRVGMDLFEDAAKIRAARRMWAELLRSRYSIDDDRALRLRVHSLTAGSAMTYQQPLNNIVRATVMALAGVLGGSQSLGVSGYDEALSIPSEHAHQISIRTQQILQHEANLTAVADPLGGSYYVESLTSEIEERAHGFLAEIEKRDGFIACLDSGWLHSLALENQLSRTEAMTTGHQEIVGITTATEDVSPFPISGFMGSSDAWNRGMARLRSLRAQRDGRRAIGALKTLDTACRSTDNMMPAMMEAVAADVTVGEIGDVFRETFGDWDVPIRF